MIKLQSRRCFAVLTLIAAVAAGCEKSSQWDGSLEALLENQSGRFGAAVSSPAQHRIQIVYTRIDRDADNVPSFKTFEYRVDPDEYFYPASTVKLPAALLALEKLDRLQVEGLDRDTPMITGAVGSSQTAAVNDATAPGGLPSVAHYVRKILLVSDNDAFNRLYEFLGQQPLNDTMQDKGYSNTRIMHRLEIALSVEDNRHTNPVIFIEDNAVLYQQPAMISERSYLADAPILLGKAEVVGNERLARPKDFAEKNAYPIREQHDVIKALMFPESVEQASRFELTPEDYRFVLENMSAYPGESGIPAYSDPDRYPPGYVKFLMYGGDASNIPENIRIFNKVGDAYGFLTDAAYIVDFDHGVEFLLAATVYVNANETFNDNEYEYDEIGMPFLRELGMAIYEMELERERPNPPDLSRFRRSE